jgi:multiple antibiotic resistance protein
MIDTLIASFVTLFVIIDPVGITPMFVSLTANDTVEARRRIALRGTVIAAVILFAFALGGEPFLRALGIGLPAFRIAGGILLMLLAIDMVMVRHSGLRVTTESEEDECSHRADVSIFPLAIPLIAGPGALTSVVLLMGRAQGDWALQGATLIVLLLVLILMLVCLLTASQVVRVLGQTGVNVLTRVFGMITAALAVQFVIDGLLQVWPSGS